MSSTIIVAFWSIAFGFVTAAILSSCFQWAMKRPMSFGMLTENGPAGSLLVIPLLAISGPVVIARNTWRGRAVQGRAWGWVWLSMALVSGWSFVIGLYVLDLVIKLRLAFLA